MAVKSDATKKAATPKTAGSTRRKTKPDAPASIKSKKTPAGQDSSPWTLARITAHIKDHAYYIWENEGRPEGSDFDIWLRAEQETFTSLLK